MQDKVDNCVGRPTKFTKERCAAIVDSISKRVPYEIAAEANGICVDTFYEWLKIAKSHRQQHIDSDYTEFSDAVKLAEQSKIIEHTSKIAQNVDRWQADAWLLERRFYKHFGANAQLNELNDKLTKLLGEDDEKASGQGSKDGNQASSEEI